MSAKRKFSDYTAETASGSTHDYAPSHQGSRHKRKKGPSQDRPTSVNWLKKRARTIERRLKREESLPANVQHELEKELDHHKQKLDHLADGRQRSNMIQKYHMIRFFERKKAVRLSKQIQAQLKKTTDDEERKKLEANLHVAEIDALYAKYHPHRERYISLYPVANAREEAKTEDASSAARSLHTERPPLWSVIEKAAKEGTSALVQIQERKSAVDQETKSSQSSSKHSSTAKAEQPKSKGSSALDARGSRKGSSKRQQPQPEPTESAGDDSDGGFFEDG